MDSAKLFEEISLEGFKVVSGNNFGKQIFSMWEWDEKLRYRVTGKLVMSDNKVLLMFDFSCPDIYEGSKLVKNSG